MKANLPRALRQAAFFIACAGASITLSGCGLIASAFSNPPPTVVRFEDATFNLQTETVTDTCFVNQNTSFGQLVLYYSNNTQATGVVYWYAPHVASTTYLKINTSSDPATNSSGVNVFHPYVTAAINAWSSRLNNPPALPAGAYFNLLPQEVTSGSTVVTSEGSQDPTNPHILGSTGFALDQYGNNITSAGMSFYTAATDVNGLPNNIPDARYGAALHEIGHAMGLAHNSQRGSVMYPEADQATKPFGPCYHYTDAATSSMPSTPYDTASLENHYDPSFQDTRADNPNCGTRTCYDIMKHVVMPSGIVNRSSAATGAAMKTGPGLGAAFVPSRYPSSAVKESAPQQWIMVNDFPGAIESSAEDLILSSSLVAQVKVGPRLMSVRNGVNSLVVNRAKLTQTFRHLLGPDERVKAGDEIAIVDLAAPKGGVYIDDPVMPENEVPIVLLKHASRQMSSLLGIKNLYAYTAHFTSKWALDRSGRMRVLSVRRSRVASDVDGYKPKELFARVLRKYGSASYSEESALRAALFARGVRSTTDLASYRRALSVGSPSLLDRFAHRDAINMRHTLDLLTYRP